MITEALWKGSKTVRGAPWNRLQPGQHFDQQRAVSCYAASGYSCRFSAASDKHFHSTVPKTELRGGDCGLERRCKKKYLQWGAGPGFLCCVVCSPSFPVAPVSRGSVTPGGELLLHVPGGSQRLKVGLLRQPGSLQEKTS